MLLSRGNEKWTLKNLKLPIRYNRSELEDIMKDKNFIEVYQDFNLQYLKECLIEGKDDKKEMRKLVKEFQKEAERVRFKNGH